MVDIDELLPRSRSPRDYLNLVADPRADQEVLRALAAGPYSFVRKVVAQHLLADAQTLAVPLPTEDLDRWDRCHVLASIACHPNADRTVLRRVLRETLALLREPDGRPYAAALALARRPELDPEEILIFAEQQGASRRMRRGLLRNLAARDP
ncbi:hypothetical protein [Phytohabitans suffuscus]|uniref:Uncharacterized protein n=1 Tax=Phytohabitans suffuscus TaxID=624315 RepID=A0A6F8YRH4_9ACTN|nr:hypothetical protein [Phytohabitans suffuscus]BCB88702.1 hypothetical protein Psuf_060150 [Phytohabitans suffuscus]